jgi:hypothetical protein
VRSAIDTRTVRDVIRRQGAPNCFRDKNTADQSKMKGQECEFIFVMNLMRGFCAFVVLNPELYIGQAVLAASCGLSHGFSE